MHIRKNNNNNQRSRKDRYNNNNQVIKTFIKVKYYLYDEKEHKLNDLTCFKYVKYQEKQTCREEKTKKI